MQDIVPFPSQTGPLLSTWAANGTCLVWSRIRLFPSLQGRKHGLLTHGQYIYIVFRQMDILLHVITPVAQLLVQIGLGLLLELVPDVDTLLVTLAV